MVDVCLLGCGGSVPTPERFLTALLVSVGGRKLLIDCGEGTQVSVKLNKLGFKSIDVILVTHFHADHIAGLPGMLLAIANSGRTDPLVVVGPEGLSKIMQGLMVIVPELPYELKLVEVSDGVSGKIKKGQFNIEILPADHRIQCFAYSIYIERKPKFDRERAIINNVPLKLWKRLQQKETAELNGKVYTQDMVLGETRRGIKISYCTDSRPTKELESFIEESDLFVCDSTYGDEEKYEKAVKYKHMLFREAAHLAKKGNVRELWLTHFSTSMPHPDIYIDNAKNVFYNTVLGSNGLKKTFNFEKRG